MRPVLLFSLLALLAPIPLVHAEESATLKRARLDAMEHVRRVAVKAGMPTGLFGVQWLMTPEEVMKKCPNVKLTADGKYLETRDCYGRKALISYHFSERDNVLLQVVVSFVGATTDEGYATVRRRLIKDFGALPEPRPTDRYLKASGKKGGGVAIDHFIRQQGPVKVEQISIYKHS